MIAPSRADASDCNRATVRRPWAVSRTRCRRRSPGSVARSIRPSSCRPSRRPTIRLGGSPSARLRSRCDRIRSFADGPQHRVRPWVDAQRLEPGPEGAHRLLPHRGQQEAERSLVHESIISLAVIVTICNDYIVDRRTFLRLTGVGAGGVLGALAGCGSGSGGQSTPVRDWSAENPLRIPPELRRTDPIARTTSSCARDAPRSAPTARRRPGG